MRLIVARCEVTYTGRLNAYLPESTRLLMLKDDGSVLVHADAGGYKPLNWMTPPTVIEDDGDDARRPQARRPERGPARDQAARGALRRRRTTWARRPGSRRTASSATCSCCSPTTRRRSSPGLRLVKREWPTDVGPVDLMCRDDDDGWVAVEIKRIGTIDAVEQLTRYLDCIRVDPARAACRGILVAQRSSRRRSRWPRAAGSRASRSTSRCCAASASPSSRSSRSSPCRTRAAARPRPRPRAARAAAAARTARRTSVLPSRCATRRRRSRRP